MKSMVFRRIAAAICLTCLCIISFASIGPVQSAAAYSVQPCNGLGSGSTPSCDGQWPQDHRECTESAYSTHTVPLADKTTGNVFLMFSPTCNAFYVKVKPNSYSTYLYADIARFNPDSPRYNADSSGDEWYSQMVGWTGINGQRFGGRGCAFSTSNCANVTRP